MRNAGVLVSIDVAVWARNPSASMPHGFVPSRGGTEFDTDPDALVTVPAFVWLGYHTGIPQADVVEFAKESAAVNDASLYERLRDAILSLELAPGARLSERGLEPEFGASRTPIRAALMRLESEGLVQRDGKNWQVTPINLEEIQALYEYRRVIESALCRMVIERASADD